MQSIVYFSLGSNLGDRYSNLLKCVSLIETNVGEIKSLSSIYKNSAQGFIGDYFYNCCVKVLTSYKPIELNSDQVVFQGKLLAVWRKV